jgi:hypothetical protein
MKIRWANFLQKHALRQVFLMSASGLRTGFPWRTAKASRDSCGNMAQRIA